MKNSLNLRLTISASIVLALFFAVAGGVLERSFRKGAQQALQERLQIQIYALLSAAEQNDVGELSVPRPLHEGRLSTPGSGLYGYIHDGTGSVVWRSKSSIGRDSGSAVFAQPGQAVFFRDPSGSFVLHYGIVWESEGGAEQRYVFTVVEDDDSFIRQVSGFSATLWFWLGSIGLLLVVVQFLILRWSVKPLRSIAGDLEAIEMGKQSSLGQEYPSELQGLVGSLNALLNSERAHLERYRNTLADLAHSLKTPLAILRGCLSNDKLPPEVGSVVREQIVRMDEIVEYQLQKAAARGGRRLSKAVDPDPVIRKIVSALDKVYGSKAVRVGIRTGQVGRYFGEEGDLYEIAGNLIDNAYKWCRTTVEVSLETIDDQRAKRSALRLVVEDDGPGIPEEKVAEILGRGIRADENIHGHGIGMAVVNELVQLLDGTLSAGKSRLGGMRWEVVLPASI